jgi:hypothetical protein
MNADLQGAISSAISTAQSKAAEKSEGNFNEQVARDRVASANQRISVAEGKVTRNQGEMAKIDEMLNPPPTKEVSEGGKDGGTKTVVDQEEVRRLNSKKSQIQQNLTQAQQEVQEAQQAAQNAASDAITQAGINQETQSEIDALTAKANNIKNTLSEGGEVDDKEIKDLVDRFNKVSGELTEENNPAGLLSEAFYEPMAEALEDISNYLENPVQASGGNENAPPPEGTADRVLYDAGITNKEVIANLVTVNTELSEFDKQMGETQSFDQEAFNKLVEKFNKNTEGLTDVQKNAGVNKGSQELIAKITANAQGGAGDGG